MPGVPQFGVPRQGEVLTQEAVRYLFDYDAETGHLTRRNHGYRHLVGKRAGTIARGRSYIRTGGKNYPATRVIWLYVYGYFPTVDIDHIDRNPLNDRLNNLPLATRIQNSANGSMSSGAKRGFKGVYAASKNRWYTTITHNYKKIYLGCFPTAEEAHAAYQRAAKRLNGEFAPY